MQPLLLRSPQPVSPYCRCSGRRQAFFTQFYVPPPGWHLSFSAPGAFLSAHFIQVVAFLMDCHF